MAIVEVGTRTVKSKSHDAGAGSVNNESHTTTNDTDLLLCLQAIEGNEDPHATDFCSFDGDDLTLIRDTGSTGDNGDIRLLAYGMVSPDAKTATGSMQTAFSAFPMLAVWINIAGVLTSSVADATNFISEDVNTAVSPSSILTSGGSAGNGLIAWGVAQASSMSPSLFDSGFTEILDAVTSATSNDFAYNLARSWSGAPSGTTVDWTGTNENAAILIELVAATSGIVAHAASHYRNQGKVF